MLEEFYTKNTIYEDNSPRANMIAKTGKVNETDAEIIRGMIGSDHTFEQLLVDCGELHTDPAYFEEIESPENYNESLTKQWILDHLSKDRMYVSELKQKYGVMYNEEQFRMDINELETARFIEYYDGYYLITQKGYDMYRNHGI